MTKKQEVVQFTDAKLMSLIYMRHDEGRTGNFALLRSGVGKSPGTDPRISELLFQDMPEGMMGRGEEPGYAEWAIYLALTLYARHQQGIDTKKKCMHESEKGRGGLGTAIAGLIKNPEEDEAKIVSRFNQIALSEEIDILGHRLCGIVDLLKDQEIPLDYARLAGDLYAFQFDEGRDRVRLSWARDFYGTVNRLKKGGKKND